MNATTLAAELATARRRLEDCESALDDARRGQAISMTGVSLSRQGLADLQAERRRLLREVRELEGALAGERPTLGAAASFPAPGS